MDQLATIGPRSSRLMPSVLDGKQTSMHPQTKARILFLSPSMAILIAITAFPTFYLLYLSLSSWNISSPVPRFIGFDNFINIARDPYFLKSFFLTIEFTIGTVLISLLLGLTISLLLFRHFPGVGLLRALFTLPLGMTPVVVGLVWRILYDPSFGLVSYLLSKLGIGGILSVSKASTALLAVIFVDVWQWTPFMFLMITAGLQSIPLTIFDVAKVDGANSVQTFLLIILPMLKYVIGVALILRTIDALKTFDIIYVLTGGGPGTATQTTNLYGYLKGFFWFDIGYAAAIVVVMIIFVNILTTRFLRILRLEE